MRTNIGKVPQISRKQIVLFTIVGIILALCGWWAYVSFSPKPLTSELEYIGKQDHGCYIGFCDSSPGSTYYYATNMTADNLKTYFTKAPYDIAAQDEAGVSTNYNFTRIHFNSSEGDFIVDYYSNATGVINSKHLTPTTKKNVISISDAYYNSVKKSL